ncbi:MAG: NAD(+)/NADH kinase [Caldilineaceae bacterium]|nr:NAD(+)/NADH kinase [Caldilineaceae bacterium]
MDDFVADISTFSGNDVPLSFQRIGILHHPMKSESLVLAQEIDDFLRAEGVEHVWHASAWKQEAMLAHISEADLLITLGGDGTLLRAARMGAADGIPMLGVKMGKLGFLAEIMPEHWREPLHQTLRGDYWTEERLMLRARVERLNEAGERFTLCEYDGLNDVVLSRGDLARVVRISAHLDGEYLTTYTCDGLITSTATGSTGYGLAVGGPILPPELRNILVIPIAPHLSMDRAIVLSRGAEVRLQAFADYHPMLTVDGQVVVELNKGDHVVITGSPHTARFLRLNDRNYFYQALMDKLSWTGTKEPDT